MEKEKGKFAHQTEERFMQDLEKEEIDKQKT